MSKTILADVDGWTPLIDHLARDYGLVTAAVFGRIWRYCQGEQQACTASLDSIARDLGIDRATVMRHAKTLCEEGFLSDMTPGLRNVPHTYADTGKAGLTVKISAKEPGKPTVAPRNTSRTVAQDNRTVAQDNKSVAESQLKIQVRDNVRNTSGGDAKTVADTQRERTEQAYLGSLQRGRELLSTGVDLVGYPNDVVDIIREACELFHFHTPRNKKAKAKWIEDARDLRHACGEFGLEPMRKFRQEMVEYMQGHNGTFKFSVCDLGSLVKSVNGMAAQMRSTQDTTPADPLAALRAAGFTINGARA